MDCKLLVKESENTRAPLVVFNEQCVAPTKTTLSYAKNTKIQFVTYANMQVCDTNDNLIATLSRSKLGICGTTEILLASSTFLTTPGEIVYTSAWSCWYLNYEWLLPDGTLLKISGAFYSSKATITASDQSQNGEIVVATLGKGQMVTIEAGVDAAAVLLLCRVWNHYQTDLLVATLVFMYFPLSAMLLWAIHSCLPAPLLFILISDIIVVVGVLAWSRVFRG